MENSQFKRFHLLIVVLCTFMIMCDGYDLFMYGTIVPSLMQAWHISAVVAGSLNSYALVGMMIGALVLGPLSDRFGRKNVIILSCIGFCVFVGLCGFADGPTMFASFRFISGLGLGGLMPNAVALVTEYSPKPLRSTLVALMFSGHPLGGVLASIIGMHLVPTTGWRSVLWVGAIPLLAVPLFYALVPDSPTFYANRGQTERLAALLRKLTGDNDYTAADEFVTDTERRKGFPVRKLFAGGRALSTIMFWLAFFMCLLTMYGLTTWLPKLMTNAGFALGSSMASLLALNLGAIAGAIVGGRLADRFGAKIVLVTAFIVAAVSMTSIGSKPSMFILFLLLFIAGGTTTGTQIVANAYVSQFYPDEVRSTGIGWALGIGRLGGILGPTMGGVLLTQHLSLPINFLAFAIPSVISAIAILFVQQRYAHVRTSASNDDVLTHASS
ncbi:aromatic acid/H+ symport family MFS transporter [Alicyclobacillus fastidiosus]|uniref:Aromatic acid/H+ symport family MFS transporter n=2 Tax=Alicyclobacillus fastidiosus TaxID=392011 RepID=A0ABV5AAW9_9BACL